MEWCWLTIEGTAIGIGMGAGGAIGMRVGSGWGRARIRIRKKVGRFSCSSSGSSSSLSFVTWETADKCCFRAASKGLSSSSRSIPLEGIRAILWNPKMVGYGSLWMAMGCWAEFRALPISAPSIALRESLEGTGELSGLSSSSSSTGPSWSILRIFTTGGAKGK